MVTNFCTSLSILDQKLSFYTYIIYILKSKDYRCIIITIHSRFRKEGETQTQKTLIKVSYKASHNKENVIVHN